MNDFLSTCYASAKNAATFFMFLDRHLLVCDDQ
jgi:hypothetical protein